MRRPFLLTSLAVLALAVAACTGTIGPGWTYAPPTPKPSAAPSDATSSAAPSAAASAAPSAAGNVVSISALNIAFEQTAVSAPADTAFVIHFDNKDAGTPHNVAIKDASGMEKFKGDTVNGPAGADYKVGPLPAGTYSFVCSIHPNMTGKLTVGG
jgi:plastocyanin